jgi:uncharacterized protein YkwD
MARHSAQRPVRRWLRRTGLLAGGAGLVAVVALAVAYVLGTGSPPSPATTSRLTGSSACSAQSARGCGRSSAQPSVSPTPAPTSPAASVPASQPSASASQPAVPASQPASMDAAAAAVLAVINQARAQAGLAAYTVLGGLETSSAAHNQLMADGCGLSHQCPGEPSLGDRETAAGVQWTAAGENIGEGGPVADTTAAISQMAVALTNDMLAEQPPDDGHRLNILSSSFSYVGIAVYRDSAGTVWMTQDFAN